MKKEGRSNSGEGLEEFLSASPGSAGQPLDTDLATLNTPESPLSETNLYTTQTVDSSNGTVQNQNMEDANRKLLEMENVKTVLGKGIDEVRSSKEKSEPSHEYLDKTLLDTSNESGNKFKEVRNPVVDKEEIKMKTDTEREIKTRIVSDKLIPEVKLEFKVQADIKHVGTSRAESGKAEKLPTKVEVET